MPRTCAVIDCLNTGKNNVSFFGVSNHANSLQYKAFLEKANAAYTGFWSISKTTSICSEHFLEADLVRLPSARIRLRTEALPVLCNGKVIVTKEELNKLVMPISTETAQYEMIDASISICDKCDTSSGQKEQMNSLLSAIKDKDREIDALRLKLQEKKDLAERYQKELRIYKQREKRESAKKRKSTEDVETLPIKPEKSTRLSTDAVQILEELTSRGQLPVTTPFSERLKEFAFEMHFYSPRAYEKCRDTLTTLPHTSSFQNWTRNVNVKPGFIPCSLDFIHNRASNSEHTLYYALALDEVHIRKQIVNNQGGFVGYIDYGNMADPVFTETEASAALFVLATEINGNHKIPLGYILSNGLKASLLKQVIERTIQKLRIGNVHVLTITFDGLPANSKAVELLGADLNILNENFSPFIPGVTEKDNIYVILDASHMIKLFRSLFKEYGVLLNEKGEEICWVYIIRLLELHEKEGLRAANKITVRHVYYQNQKMKTKLAAQTLSGSSAISLRFARLLKIPGFELTQATEEFLEILNLLFDYLNSITKGIGARAPLRWSNYQQTKAFFDKARKYLLSLKWRGYVKGNLVVTPLVTTPRGFAVKGLLITMRSLELIMVNVLSDPNSELKFLPTFKVSQDPLENFFSTLRSRFGFNNNPNVLQLQHDVKGIMCMKTVIICFLSCNIMTFAERIRDGETE